ncbi:hypothetical protein ACI3LY_000228 [Candidozyma auris]|uniref:BHLH domain-containing protein n=2 Tax=Candidozyma auris TaxID=498019 RepID=A0AB36WBJ6_CANAR|nr:hypothetical protein QG37_02738 [[Candida] auris]PIS57794.1 hypothetical protein CJI97_000844 [[Candida] auris]PIS58332.1 hypothetical protein B9J08_000826 [[Candida] auris]QWW23587.1 hypothetical protein CA7LBN_002388 [[Candida] auris]
MSAEVADNTSSRVQEVSEAKDSNGDPPQTPTVESSQAAEIGHSPSGSVSSVESSESTKKLIHSLSKQGLSGVLPGAENSKKNDEKSNDEKSKIEDTPNLNSGASTPATDVSAVQSPLSDTFPVNGGQGLPKERKPVKFTVRKVSRETINTSATSSSSGQRQYSYGNLPENQEPKERKPLTKNEQLQRSQNKYDSYAVRIEKINKEIDFLTNLLPPYNVEIDYATRNKIARAIEKLKMKQDEIEKKKYSLGITLSRLWREHDERELWVRSVSNQ